MNPRERIQAAINHETPDRVPVMCQLALGHYFMNSDRHPSDIWFDSETFVQTLAEFRRRYRFDGFLINLPGRPANWKEYLSPTEDTGRGEKLQDEATDRQEKRDAALANRIVDGFKDANAPVVEALANLPKAIAATAKKPAGK